MASKHWPIIRDVIIGSVFIVFTACIHTLCEPSRRGYLTTDMTIRYPHAKTESVPMTLLWLFAFGGPLLVMFSTWFFIDKIHVNDFNDSTLAFESVEEISTGVALLDKTPAQVSMLNNASDPGSLNSTYNNLSGVGINGSSSATNATVAPAGIMDEPDHSSSHRHAIDMSSQHNNPETLSLISSSSVRPILGVVPPVYTITENVATQYSGITSWAHAATGSPRQRKIYWAMYQFLIFGLVALNCQLITNVAKLICGRLRPDFIDRCQPDYSLIKVDPDYPWISPEQQDIICQGDPKIIKKGRVSFFSGHTSSAVVGAMYMIIYLSKRWATRWRRHCGYLLLPLVQFGIMAIALGIACSRYLDYRHHWEDIVVGFLVGLGYGFLYLVFPAFTPPWEYDGTVLRSKQQRHV